MIFDGKQVKNEIRNEDVGEALQRYTDYVLAKEFGYTPEDIANLPQDWYEDILAIMNLKGAKEQKMIDEQTRKSKRRR